MPAKYEGMGIRFEYPDGWSLDDESAAESGAVTVYSPGGAFWSVALHPWSTDPIRLAKSAVEAMQQEYEGLESSEARQELLGHEFVGYDMNFIYLDLTNSAQIRSSRLSDQTMSVFCQGEDREFDQLHEVFLAMTLSVLSSIDMSDQD